MMSVESKRGVYGLGLRSPAWVALSALLCLWAGCGDDDDDEADGPRFRDSAVDGDSGSGKDGGADDEPCPEDAEGESCGGGKYCVHGVCAFNVCGDGVRAGAEACDDGNQRTGDGCDPACRAESTSCGDAIVNDEAEE